MIRRHPTAIALDENEIEIDWNLQRIFLHTLTVDLEQLHLKDNGLSSTSTVSTTSDADFDIKTSTHGSCSEQNSPNWISSTTIPQPPMKSCLKTPSSHPYRSLKKTTSCPADGTDPPMSMRVTYALSSQELEPHSGRAIRPLEETGESISSVQIATLASAHLTSAGGREVDSTRHNDTICTPMSLGSSESPQISFLSCGVSSSPATVPLRDLALASTMSYEAALAEETVSSASATDGSEGRDLVI